MFEEAHGLSSASKVLGSNYMKAAVLGIMVLAGVVGLWFGFKAILRTEYPLLAVASGSMRPTLNIGDLIVVQGVLNFSEIEADPKPEGDIIVFHRPSKYGQNDLIVHRAVNRFFKDGSWYFITQGDGNSEPDPWGAVPESLIVGRVVGWVPWLGNIPLFIRTPTGMSLVVLLFIVLILVEFIPMPKKKEHEGSES